VYIFINIIILSIQIYQYKTELDLPRVRLNGRLNSCLARLMLFISVPFRPFFPFFYRLNSQPFNFRLPPKQNSLPPFTGRLIRLGEHWFQQISLKFIFDVEIKKTQVSLSAHHEQCQVVCLPILFLDI